MGGMRYAVSPRAWGRGARAAAVGVFLVSVTGQVWQIERSAR
ncbi:MAG TPA: hypothetical protein VFJ97_02480 [Dermatophilaceae bacterium]|nr:hypothetical protein [Dermatophilaceae bacterium]